MSISISRGSDNHKVTFGSLKGGEKFLGSKTGRKFIKLARATRDGKNCATIEGGLCRTVSDGEMVERVGALKVPFSVLQEGELFLGTKTPSVMKKIAVVTRANGKKANAVRLGKGDGCVNYFYLKGTLVEPLSGHLEVSGY